MKGDCGNNRNGPQLPRSHCMTDYARNNQAEEADGTKHASIRDPPGPSCVYVASGDHRRGQYRLSTFTHFPAALIISIIDLATNGFYYTGHKDRVRCFSCGMVVDNFCVGDDANDRNLHKSDCDLMNGRECGNVPGQFSQRRALFADMLQQISRSPPRNHLLPTPSSWQVRSPTDGIRSIAMTMESRPGSSGLAPPVRYPELRLAKIESESHKSMILSIDLAKEADRRSSFVNWPSFPAPALASKLAKEGFFYLGNLDRTQCFSCSGVLRNWTRTDEPRVEHTRHFPNCLIVLGQEGRNIPLDSSVRESMDQELQQRIAAASSILPQEPADPSPEEQRHLAEHYPCLHPSSPHMVTEEARLATFNSAWLARIKSTPRQIAKAGFYFLGDRDRAKCFYCNGGLQNWDDNDEPWTEHAKWFPGCAFVLRRKGVEFVRRIAEANPNLSRPTIRNPVSYNIPSCSETHRRHEFSGQPSMIPVQAGARGMDVADSHPSSSQGQREGICKVCSRNIADVFCRHCNKAAFCSQCSDKCEKCPLCNTQFSSTARKYRS